MLKGPCNRMKCKHWEEWSESLPYVLDSEEMFTVLMKCLACHHFMKEDNYVLGEGE